MPVSTSDPRRTTIIGVIGLVVGTVLILAVLLAGNLGGDDKKVNSKTQFDAGLATNEGATIDRDGPIAYPDPAGGSRPIFVQHIGDDFLAFDAVTRSDCVLTWHQDTRDFTDCDGQRFPANGGSLHHYPVSIDGDKHVIVDVSVDATTTTSS